MPQIMIYYVMLCPVVLEHTIMVDSTGTIRCRHESNVDIPGDIHHTTGLHQLPPLHLHQPAISTIGKMVTLVTIYNAI